MKVVLTSVSILALVTATSAYAGGVKEPIMKPAVVEQQSASSGNKILVPLLLLLIVVAAISSSKTPLDVDDDSDARLKTDLRPIGVAANGLSLYRFRYIGRPEVYEGVMAQDVLERFPWAVSLREDGYMRVNYVKLGLKMTLAA